MESNALGKGLMKPEQALQHVAQQWHPVIERYDLTESDMRGLVEVDALAHGKAPDAATREKWVSEAKAALLATYGPAGVGQALADAQAFVRQDPQLTALAGRGFGDHKALVLVAARLGSQARKAGRLR